MKKKKIVIKKKTKLKIEPINKYELEIPKEVYEKDRELVEWWKEYDGFINKETVKEWKKWNIKKESHLTYQYK